MMWFCSPLCIWSLPSGRTGTAPERRAARGRCAAPWRAKKCLCAVAHLSGGWGGKKSEVLRDRRCFLWDRQVLLRSSDMPPCHTPRTHTFSPPSSERLRGCDESEDGQAKVETKRGRLNSWSPKMQHESDVIVPQIISEVDGWIYYIIALVKLGTSSCKE